jgi:hypothetical protein
MAPVSRVYGSAATNYSKGRSLSWEASSCRTMMFTDHLCIGQPAVSLHTEGALFES